MRAGSLRRTTRVQGHVFGATCFVGRGHFWGGGGGADRLHVQSVIPQTVKFGGCPPPQPMWGL